MKIAYSARAFRVQREGGISRYFHQLILGVLENGHEVFLGSDAPDGKYVDSLKETKATFEKPQNQLFSRVKKDERTPFGYLPIDLRKWEPDIIHETFYSSKWFKGAPKYTKKVLTVYDLIAEKSASHANIVSQKQEALIMADHLICISESTRRDLIRYYDISIEKTSVIRLAPYPLPMDKGGSSRNEQFSQTPYFLYVGSRGGYKNFEIAIRAFSILIKDYPYFHFIAFGGGPFTQQEILQIRNCAIEEKVHFQEGDDYDLANAYRGATALIYPSIWEGFGMPPLEAMFFETPVISSINDCSLEILGTKSCLFFDPQIVESLVEKMKIVISINYDRAALLQEMRDTLSRYSWKSCIDETLLLYKKLGI